MKKLITLASILCLFALTASAQIGGGIGTVAPSGVVHDKFTTNTGPIMVLAAMNTNFTAAAQRIIPVPQSGRFGFFASTGGTNANTTTNCNCIVEALVFDGTRTNVVDNYSITFWTYLNGTTPYDTATNFPTTLTDNRSYAGIDAFRLRSCTNTHTDGSIWFTNLFMLRYP